MDGRDADRASSTGAALRWPAGRGAGAPAQAFVLAVRGGAAGAGGGGGSTSGAVRAHRRLRAGGNPGQAGAGHGGGDGVAIERERGIDRAFPPGGMRALDAGASVAYRASGQGRGAVAGRDRATPVPQQELGVAAAGTAQGALAAGAGQSGGRANSTAGGDEVSVAVGPGQRCARAHAGRGTWQRANHCAADGPALCRVPRRRPGGAGAALRITALVSASGGARRACGEGPGARDRAPDFGSGCYRGPVWASSTPSTGGHFRRGIRGGARAHRVRAAVRARGSGDAGRGDHGEASR